MQQKGYSRRDFLQFCAAAATVAGFGQTGVAQVVSAFEKKEKPAVVWMHFQECTCCSESFIRASHPIVADALLDVLDLNYTETLMAASGFQAEKSLSDTIKNNKGKYIVLVEGAVPTKDDGVYCMIGGRTAESILQTVAADAAAVVAWGSCASNGCVQAAKPNPTGATPIYKLVNKPVINVPGCPPIAGARQPGPSQGVLRATRTRYVLSPAELRCRAFCGVVRRRERAQGVLPLQDGLPRTGHVQRLLGNKVERGHQLSDSVGSRVHRLQRSGFLGQWPVLPAPGLVPRIRNREHGRHDRHGGGSNHAGRSCGARGGDEHTQAAGHRRSTC
jgi:hypothetical protein